MRDAGRSTTLTQRASLLSLDTGTGDTLHLLRLGEGRALLFGYDDSEVDTYFREAALYFGEPETNLIAGGPHWWGDALAEHVNDLRGRRIEEELSWVTYLFGWDGTGWQRSSVAPDESGVRQLLDWIATWPMPSDGDPTESE